MHKTDNLELNLPEKKEKFNIDHFNENFEIIDTVLKEIAKKLGG